MLVAQTIQGTEEDGQRNLLLDQWNGAIDTLVILQGELLHGGSSLSLLALDLHSEELGWLVRVFSLRANLRNPRILRRGLFLEDVDHVVSHPLLGYYDFLAAIDDKVASLVIATVLAILHALMLIQILELAEVAPQHDWNLANVDSLLVLLVDGVLDLPLSLAGLRTVLIEVIELLLAELEIGVQLCGIGQISHSGLVREYRRHVVVGLHDAWAGIDVDLAELDLVDDVLV